MTDTPTSRAQSTAPGEEAAAPDTRILHLAKPLHAFPCTNQPRGPLKRIAIVDVETTGFDPELDQVIDIAVALVRVDAFGRITDVIDVAESLRDPGCEIPERIKQITGIADEDVAGVSFDPAPFEDLLSCAELCIAHNAAFDAPFIEARLPRAAGLSWAIFRASVAGLRWACSMADFDWFASGFDGCKLGHLLMQVGKFGDNHRAIADVTNLAHVLSHELGDTGTILGHVARSAERTTVRVEATGAPYARRLELKEAGYKWDSIRRVWWTEVLPELADLEGAWLEDSVLPPRTKPQLRPVTSRERYR